MGEALRVRSVNELIDQDAPSPAPSEELAVKRHFSHYKAEGNSSRGVDSVGQGRLEWEDGVARVWRDLVNVEMGSSPPYSH